MRPMKESGIEWIGEMPERWEICKVKQCATNEKTLFNDGDWIESPYITDSGIMLIQTGNIGEGFYKEQGYRFISEETFHKLQCKYVYPNDILISRLASPVGRACLAPNLEDKMICSVDVCILRANSDIDRRYLNYYFALNGYIEHTDLIARGTTLQRISRTQLGNILVILPSFPEQQAIADYLDTKCNLIDSTIEKQKKVIEKLQSYKQSLITEAVTKGLDPTVKMKPSGIEWMGYIPEGWEVVKGKYLFKIYGTQVSEYHEKEYIEVPYFKVDNLNQVKNNFYISEVPEKIKVSSKEAVIVAPVILIPKRGAAIYTNKVRIIEMDCFFDPNIMALKPIKDNIVFLSYVIFGRKLSDIGDVNTIPQINNKHIYILDIPLPTLPEQQSIANYLDTKCYQIDNAISIKQKLIDKLTDYKKSLIYECVTGKKEVTVNA